MGGFSQNIDGIARASATTANSKVIMRLTSISGVDTIVSSALPTGFVSLADLAAFTFESVGANTGAATLNIGDGVNRPLTQIGGAALIAGDIPAADTLVECFYDLSTNSYHAQLIRQPSAIVGGADTVAGAVGTSTRYARADHLHVNSGAITSSEDATVVSGSTTLATYTDTLVTLALTAGTYALQWGGTISIQSSGGTGACLPELTLTDAANTVIKRAVSGSVAAGASTPAHQNVTGGCVITIAAPTTYKLRFCAALFSGTPILTGVNTNGTTMATYLIAERV